MANEITYTGKADLFIAATLNRMIHQDIVDRSDLLTKLTDFGDATGSGSTASKVSRVAFDDAMAPANADEVTPPANTDLGTAAATITVARQALVRTVSDLYEMIDGGGRVGIQAFAQDMSNAAILRSTDMVTALFPTITAVVGVTGTDLTSDDIFDAQYTLIQASVTGPYCCVLAPKQITDFIDSLRGEQGAMQWQQATADMIGTQGWGIAGTWNGIEFWSVDSVPTTGPDKDGAMFGPDWAGFRRGVPASVTSHAAPGSIVTAIPNGSSVFVEFERKAAEAHTTVVGNLYIGVSEVETARAVKIKSSAT